MLSTVELLTVVLLLFSTIMAWRRRQLALLIVGAFALGFILGPAPAPRAEVRVLVHQADATGPGHEPGAIGVEVLTDAAQETPSQGQGESHEQGQPFPPELAGAGRYARHPQAAPRRTARR